MKPLRNGIGTGLLLQLALGPVFFYVLSLVLQKSLLNALFGVLAVTIVDSIFVIFAIFGTTQILENKKVRTIFGVISAFVLIIFGFIIARSNTNLDINSIIDIRFGDLMNSFVSTFIMTIVNPLTIVFFTGLFTTKAIENNYTRKELYLFGAGAVIATLIFMGSSVIVFSLLKSQIPLIFISILKKIVGVIIMGYGTVRLIDLTKKKLSEYY